MSSRNLQIASALMCALPMLPGYGGGNAYEQIMANDARGISNDIRVKVQPNRPPGSHRKRRRQLAALSKGQP